MTLRTLSRSAALLFALAITAAGTGCGSIQDMQKAEKHGVGNLSVELVLADGSILNTVSYTISGNGITPVTGNIPISMAGATISAAISGIQVGTHYHITLTGTTTDGKSTCVGDSFFDILAGQTTMVSIAMQCTAQTTDGTVVVNATENQCPIINAFSVQPLVQTIPGTITVTSGASDPENNTLSFKWTDSAGAGSFANDVAANTTFACNLKTATTLTVTVDDGHGCSDSASIMVTCNSAAVCGDGVTGPGEQCDDSNTVNTDACVNCRTASCGDGFVQAGVEACDDGNKVAGDGCENDCTRTAGCGNGILEAARGETCDDGNNTSCDGCSAACKTEGCNNGVVECAEVCDGTLTATGTLPLGSACGTGCTSIVDNCRTCENQTNTCKNYLGSGLDLVAGCYGNANPTFVQKCTDAVNCARTQNCAYGTRGPELCYCGTLDSAACSATGAMPNGACQQKFQDADTNVTSSTPAASIAPTVTTDFGDTSLPIGNAVFLLKCDARFCKTTSATTTCVP